MELDKKDCMILNILQDNCRASFTEIAKKVGLSIDTVTKRVKRMEGVVFYPKIQIRPRQLGFNHIVEVRVKFSNHSKKEIDSLMEFLKDTIRVVEIFKMSGEWDMSFLVVAKDISDYENIVSQIQERFGENISSWSDSTTLKVYKFEKYDLVKMINCG